MDLLLSFVDNTIRKIFTYLATVSGFLVFNVDSLGVEMNYSALKGTQEAIYKTKRTVYSHNMTLRTLK